MTELSVVEQLFSQFGTAGIIIAYLVWDRLTTGKDRREMDRQQVESNIKLAEALAGLKTLIEQRGR